MKNNMKHQVIWVVVAIVCNLYSWWRLSNGLSPLSTTDPLQGIFLFVLFIPSIVAGYNHWYKTYFVANSLFLLTIAYGGIFLHIYNIVTTGGFNGYMSPIGWLAAVLINVYGIFFSLKINVDIYKITFRKSA